MDLQVSQESILLLNGVFEEGQKMWLWSVKKEGNRISTFCMEELRGTFENSATENPLVSDSQKKPRI